MSFCLLKICFINYIINSVEGDSLKTKNDFIKLVEGKDLQYKPIYLAFGYYEDVTKDEESKVKIGGKIYSEVSTVTYLKRDYNRKNYAKLVSLQEEYFDLYRRQHTKPKKINKLLFLFLFILGIIPAFIYLISFKSKKKKIENYSVRLNEILEEAKKLSSEK